MNPQQGDDCDEGQTAEGHRSAADCDAGGMIDSHTTVTHIVWRAIAYNFFGLLLEPENTLSDQSSQL